MLTQHATEPALASAPASSSTNAGAVSAADFRAEPGELALAVASGRVGSVHSWDLVTAADGPGTRMTLFLAGCPMRCLYCQNPDTWRRRNGTLHTVDEVMERVLRYRTVMSVAGGGLTISGGEPLLQSHFVASILRRCREAGIHTALDTSGVLGARLSDADLSLLDLVLLDIKSGLPETYRNVTGRELQPTLDFARRLSAHGTPMWIRFVLVPGLTDAVDNVDAVASFAATLTGVERVEVLPFHQMGRDKWDAAGEDYALADTEPPSAELLERVRDQFRAHGLST